MGKVEAIFNGLPKPKDRRSFYEHDLPLLTTIDPKLAVHRSNNQNRDATPGQKAMAFAMQFPNTQQGKRNDLLKNLTGSHKGTEKVYVSQARYVLRNSPMVEGERYPRRCLSANVHRRHLTKGQQAMAVALAYPNPEQGKRETSLKIKEVGINAGYISQARFILKHDPDNRRHNRRAQRAMRLAFVYPETQE